MKTSLIAIALLCASITFANAAAYVPGVDSYIAGTTNAVYVNGTNTANSVVYGNQTINFNMPGINNTNIYPAINVIPQANLVGIRYWGVSHDFNCVGTNNQTVTYTYAVSPDTSMWLSNYCVYSLTCNGTSRVQTNAVIDSGPFPFVALQSILMTNSGAVITNNILKTVGKPGN